MQAVVNDLAPREMRGRHTGVLSVCFGAALMVGAPLGGWVLDHLGSATLWGGCFGIGTLASALYLGVRRHIVAPPAAG